MTAYHLSCTDGKIRYDGININKIKKADLRRSLGIVLQDTNLFTGSVMENIRYGRLDATDDECIAAAKLSGADDFITRLPQGYDTELSGNGANLSQGQRQLIAIARAAVADPPVMILDEATSSIDTRTEAIVQRGMDKLMEGRTVFVIAHRLSTVMNSDILREEDKYMADQAKQWLSVQSYVSQGGYVLLPRKALGHLPIALMRRVLLQAVWQVGQDSLDFQSLERLRTLALLGQSGQKTSSEKVMAQVEGPDFYLYPGTTQHRDEMDKKEVLELLYQKWMQKPVDNIDKTVIIDSNRKQETKGPWQITIRCLSEKPKDLVRNQYLLVE